MEIISHRGYWLKLEERNSLIAFKRSFDMNMGTETDLRDYNGEIVVSHDFADKTSMPFETLLEIMDGRNLTLALNIKADGLAEKIKALLSKYNHTNYFTFDMSIPDLVKHLELDLKVFSGLSDIQPHSVLLDECEGVWLDAFKSDWYSADLVDEILESCKKVCIVSADLHKREVAKQWEVLKHIKAIKSRDLMICTDRPVDAKAFFGEKNMAIKAVIFDMDGVLIEAKDWHYEALNQALALFGYEINRHEHLTIYDGLPTKTKLKRLSLEKGLPEYLHGFINKMKQQYTLNLVQNLCRPRFCHEYALTRLKKEGYKLAVASNSIRDSIEVMMVKSHLKEHFDFMLSNEDVVAPKPNPEIYIKAINLLGLSPDECMIVEDNENGIRAAYDSGANVMIVKEVEDTNYENIQTHIEKFNKVTSFESLKMPREI